MSRHKSHSTHSSAIITISVIIWLFVQLALVFLLFFWPLARDINSSWSELINVQGKQLMGSGLDISFEWFAVRLVVYVPISIVIMIGLSLITYREQA